METPARHLLLHGSIVLLIGLICGAPYGRAIVQHKSDEVVRAWKLAHGALSLGATTMIAIASTLSSLQVSEGFQWALASCMILSGYGFCVALTTEPFANGRGLTWSGTGLNKVVYTGNIIGAGASLVGAIALLIASYLSL